MYRCIQFWQQMHLRQFWCLKFVLRDESGVNKANWAPGEPNMRHLKLKPHQTLQLGLPRASKTNLFQKETRCQPQNDSTDSFITFHHVSSKVSMQIFLEKATICKIQVNTRPLYGKGTIL